MRVIAGWFARFAYLRGRGRWDDAANRPATVRICPEKTPAANYGFDVTPARLVTGILTERGLAPATRAGLRALYADLHP